MAVFSVSFFVAEPAFAQSVADPNSTLNEGVRTIEQPLGLPSTDIRLIIARVIRAALGLMGIILVGLVLYAGFLWMTAGGNEEQIAQAKKILRNAVVGLVIILSAYAIVTFVMRLLGVGEGGGVVSDKSAVSVNQQNFQGSGALGGIIKDHYPARDQESVPRNTKIIITFRKPIKPDSFILNSNQSKNPAGQALFGDCVNIGSAMDWKKDCDQLILDNEHINITRADNNQPVAGAAALVSYENGKVFTVVLRPYDYLGSSSEKVGYKVRLGKAILLDDLDKNNPSIFTSRVLGNDYYEWRFTCSTELDIAPPVVRNIFPADGTKEAKNVVIQVDFSEAMDPSVMQGSFRNDAGEIFYLDGRNIFLKTAASTVPVGKFVLTNGYRTLEFTSAQECGTNACGGKIYCLPVCNRAGASCSEDRYDVLLKAARTFGQSVFEAIPFSGIMDASGNALDGNANNRVDAVSSTVAIFPDQQKPDNFFWHFRLSNTIDATAPYLKKIAPGIDAENVDPRENIILVFSKRMRIDPMYDIAIEEKPVPIVSLCKVPRVNFLNDNSTETTLTHCPFNNKEPHYYFPVLTSALEDVNFNCFYPGKGPGGQAQIGKGLKQSLVCDETGKNCCTVTSTISNRSFCCNGAVTDAQGNQQSCLDYLRGISL